MSTSPPIQELLATALRHHQAGQLDAAEAGYRQVLRQVPDHADALQLLGTLEGQKGRLDEGVALLARALEVDPQGLHIRQNLAILLRRMGQVEAALPHLEEIWRLRRDAASCHELATACNDLGNLQDARGDLPAAEASLRRAVALSPDFAQAWSNLGDTLRRRGRLNEALAAHEKALQLAPQVAEIHSNMGNALLQAAGPIPEALACFERAASLNPRAPRAWMGMGNVLQESGRFAEAALAYREALALEPGNASMMNNLGRMLTLTGKFAEARAQYGEALRVAPHDADLHASLIFCMDLDPTVPLREAYAERRRYHERHAAAFLADVAPHSNPPDPERRLRVGYVSGDFSRHSAAMAFGPVLFAHDPGQVEVWCFSEVVRPDEDTRRFQALAGDRWCSTVGMGDAEVAALVRKAGIDILVDLSGHTAGNRLLVFARRPAPVQVNAWGYAMGTGLDAMDYIIADDITLPEELECCYRERPVRLPSILCYQPATAAPPVAPLPAASAGFVTFGCFNRYSKVGAAMLGTWARILEACPGSRLLLKAAEYDEEQVRREVCSIMGGHGIAPERITFRGRTSQVEHQEAYGTVDIGLDPHPCQGGITSLESLWMGVPFVTLAGQQITSRLGAVFLTRLGLEDWVTTSMDDYVATAVARAADLDRLATLRAELRPRMAASPLADPQQYCRHVEAAYREMWRAWCARQPRP